MILLLCSASLFVGTAHPDRSFAGETAIISSVLTSQVDSTNSLRPSADGQIVPYQTEQNINETERPGLKEYIDASEEISLFGIDLRIGRRKAEKEIQGLLVVATAAGGNAIVAAYDLIIGVDGSRVTNFLDFYDCMRDVQPGENRLSKHPAQWTPRADAGTHNNLLAATAIMGALT
jgi:PDZ domain-containing secreted protein